MIQEAEILEDGQTIVWIKGGRGGLGNQSFCNTPQTRLLNMHNPVKIGEEGWKVLELKVLADVGLGGLSQCRQIDSVIRDHCSKTQDCRLCIYHDKSPTWNG